VPQLTFNNNFATTIELMFQKSNLLSSKQALLKEWIAIAKDEADWTLGTNSTAKFLRLTGAPIFLCTGQLRLPTWFSKFW
jgi:hypothetical protein